ncbi:hypothetical protein EZV62_018209 [Acer yangbiense]|uniref:DUF659 domain-containing protein n=1 Tax=Acer yangbiense TaxID=1000413 RepID=A0A5C7HKX3_9ROSI|nr:hypothetical protein EZV62_018209 [Acer yangbiense]
MDLVYTAMGLRSVSRYGVESHQVILPCRNIAPLAHVVGSISIETTHKKKNKNKGDHEIKREVNLIGIEEEEEVEGLGTRKIPHFPGPLDKFATKITPEASMSASKSVRQQHINDVFFKERTYSVHRYVARWVYEAGVHFNAIQNHSFIAMMEATGFFGPRYKQPSRYQLSGPLLKEEFDSTKDALKKQEEEWKLTGCSIMIDAWTDRKRRSIMNLCVNCKEVGPQNVVQVVTDSAANNIALAKMLREKMLNIFWSSCATYTINLMLEAIGANEMTQPRRSARIPRDLEEEFEYEDEPVEEENFDFESDEEQVLERYGEEQDELDT